MRIVIIFSIVFTFIACQNTSNQTTSNPQPPNIILILADDMGYSDLGCYGSEINTPHLDRLASEGVRFSQFYNNARCCPSRAALMTGLYPHQVGVGGMTDTDIPIPEYQGFISENAVTIADVLSNAGYSTYLSGKWHLGEEPENWPLRNGFDQCFAFINGAASYFDFKPYWNETWPPGNELTVVRNDQPVDLSDQNFYATDLYTDEAINFINQHPQEKPFFLYLAYTAPHWPLHALPEDIRKYDGKYEAGWDQVRQQRYQNLQKMGLIGKQTDLSEKFKPENSWTDLSLEERKNEALLMQVYAAMIDRVDQNIGRLLNELEQNGILNNTVIMFLSDNGAVGSRNLALSKYAHPRWDPEAKPGTPESFTGMGKPWANVSNTPFREFKSSIYEGGIATPFIAWYPTKFPAGSINHSVTHIVDVMPTITELAGTSYPQTFDNQPIKPKEGISLVQSMIDQQTIENRKFFFEHLGNCGVIDVEWKLVRFRNQPWELYHLQNDRSETRNLAGANPGKLNELIQKYERWAQDNNVLPREEVEAKIPFNF